MMAELMGAALAGAAVGALVASVLWFVGMAYWIRREVQSWRAQQDKHERQTQRWMADWAASSSGMPVDHWERTLYELQEEIHRRGGLQRDRRGIVRQREG
jgi:hypothetical protein